MSNVVELKASRVQDGRHGFKHIEAIALVFPGSFTLKREAFSLLLNRVTKDLYDSGSISILGDGMFDKDSSAEDAARGLLIQVVIRSESNDPRTLLEEFYSQLRHVLEDPRTIAAFLYGD